MKIGNVYSIKMNDGFGLIQLVKLPEDNTEVELIKVFYGIFYEKENQKYDELNFFMVRFPLKSAIKKHIVEKVDKYDSNISKVNLEYELCMDFFKQAYQVYNIRDEKYYNLIDFSDDEIIKMPLAATWNDTKIIEVLNTDWSLLKEVKD
jgi:hypothetical protein